MNAFALEGDRLTQAHAAHAGAQALPEGAAWIDLCRPTDDETAALAARGISIPTLEEMREIEVSNRFYRIGDTDYVIITLPGMSDDGHEVTEPVAFILAPDLLVTVRHHRPRALEALIEHPDRSAKMLHGEGPEAIFLLLVDGLVGRLADKIESAERTLDRAARAIFAEAGAPPIDELEAILRRLGSEGETLGRVRLGIVSLERALAHTEGRLDGAGLAEGRATQQRDLAALAEHAGFVSGRVGMLTDATLGMISVAQNDTVSIVSVVTALFLPPTLVASIYGMNFRDIPALHSPWGFWISVAIMVASTGGTWLFFKRKGWL